VVDEVVEGAVKVILLNWVVDKLREGSNVTAAVLSEEPATISLAEGASLANCVSKLEVSEVTFDSTL